MMIELLLSLAAAAPDENAITKYCMSKFEHWKARARSIEKILERESTLQISRYGFTEWKDKTS